MIILCQNQRALVILWIMAPQLNSNDDQMMFYVISDRLFDDLPPQMNILNMAFPNVMHFWGFL